MAESDIFEGRLWTAVTMRSGESYIGALVLEEGTDHHNAKKALICGGGYVQLKPVYIFKDLMLTTPQGMGKVTQCMPVFDSCGDVQKWIRCQNVESAIFLDELTEDDQSGYKNFVNHTRKQLREAKAKKSGIVVPKGPMLPPGGGPSAPRGSGNWGN